MAGEGLIEQKVLLVIPRAHQSVLPSNKLTRDLRVVIREEAT
jgi:hypothetical protein